MRGGLLARQWLALDPSGRSVRNLMLVAKLGVPVARRGGLEWGMRDEQLHAGRQGRLVRPYVNDTLIAEGSALAIATILRHAQAHGPVTRLGSVEPDAEWLRGRGGLPVSLAEVCRSLH